MIFNRKVIEIHQAATPPLSLVFAIPDHPWVDNADGAAVRIAMTVAQAGQGEGRLLTVKAEFESEDGEVDVELDTAHGLIHADLKIGANLLSAKPLRANEGMSNRGVIPHGAGFTITPDDAIALGLGTTPGVDALLRPYRNGRDLTGTPRGVLVIDLYGLDQEEVREKYPAVFQWLLERVKPERDHNSRPRRRDLWWRFAEDQPRMRASIAGLSRYIVTGQVAKHRVFQFVDSSVLPDDKLIVVAIDDPLMLGVLTSSVHEVWALAQGGTLEDRPVYSKTRCFDTFPLPSEETGLTLDLATRIRHLAEQIDSHRKARQVAHPGLTVTGMYNVLQKLRNDEELTAQERGVHDHGLISVLNSLHADLDSAVFSCH